jgi:hypothetical protein
MSSSLSRQARREQRRRIERQQRFDERYGESVMER